MVELQVKSRLSRRRRRVLWTSVLLVIGAVAAAAMLVRAYRQRHGVEYRPGEANSDITESLAQDLPRDAPHGIACSSNCTER